jgi:hypothetical protein
MREAALEGRVGQAASDTHGNASYRVGQGRVGQKLIELAVHMTIVLIVDVSHDNRAQHFGLAFAVTDQ